MAGREHNIHPMDIQMDMEEAKRNGNIYINPDLTGYTIISFERSHLQKMIEYGESETLKHIDELRMVNNI